MRVRAALPWLASCALLSVIATGSSKSVVLAAVRGSWHCQGLSGVTRPKCGTSEAQPSRETRDPRAPFPAGEAPVFLLASVQPFQAPEAWRAVYHEVERCAGKRGDFDSIRWAMMEAPLQGPKGPTFAFTVKNRIVLVRDDTTYLRHEMLHHVLEVSGWQPRALKPGERYTIADLHPMPLFGLCTGGR